MKHVGIRKALSTAFAIALAASSMVPAYAATITVTNPAPDASYSAYKIFDAVKVGDGEDIYRYTIDEGSEWFGILGIKADDGTVASTIEGMTIHKAESDASTTHVVTFDGDSEKYIADLVAKIRDNLEGKTANATLTNNGNVASAEVTDAGYYFVNTSTGALCNLFTATEDVQIIDKNKHMFDKALDYTEEEMHRDFAIGDNVKFRIDSNVPSTLGYTKYTYVIGDTMPEQLKLKTDSVRIAVGDVELATDKYTIDAKETGFEITFDMLALNGDNDANAMKPIAVTYTAVVKDNAKFGVYENNAKLIHGPYEKGDPKLKEEHDKENIFNHQIIINKVDGGAAEKAPLSGADFVLCKEEGDKVFFYKMTAPAAEGEDPKIEWVEAAGIADVRAAVQNKTVADMADAGTITKATTNDAGVADFSGLRCGTYFLIETKAPAKYNPLLEPVKVALTATEEGISAGTNVYQVESEVENIKGSVLPATGGMGTTLFYLGGCALVVGAFGALAAKRRTEED